jgi:dihydrofolate synthase/folylpolyglutamate synthase
MYQQLPMFQNVGKAAFKKDLTNTLLLLERLGNPHRGQKWIHIAGTNGKGSVSSMVAATLSAHGYKTGLYTSPHLVDFRERIRIDGQCISESTVLAFMETLHDDILTIQPSFFEITVALAFYHFQQESVDFGVIEVGLGGRLDSTNVISPILSVITNIGWDHMDMLGNTLEAIAREKAGIIKDKTPVVIGPMLEGPLEEITKIALDKNAKIYRDRPVDVGFDRSLTLKGDYQSENLITFTGVIEALKDLWIPIKRSNVLDGLSRIKELTGLRGRWEILNHSPFVVADTAHNEPGVICTMNQLQRIKAEHGANARVHIVWGMVSDKDRSKILRLLPAEAKYYFCKPSVIRGFDANLLKDECLNFGLIGEAYDSVGNAYDAALEAANLDDIIYVGGSTFVVGDVLSGL